MVIVLIVIIAIFVIFILYQKNKYIHQLEEKTKEANYIKSAFISRMSHEILTPMNAIIGMVDIAKASKIDAEKDECINQIGESSQYLLQIINDILDMNIIEKNKLQLKEDIIFLPDFINSVLKMVNVSAKEKHIYIKTDFSNAIDYWTKMDTLRCKQIYINLFNNAIKFSDAETEIELKIEDTQVDENHIHRMSTITDNGCGMSKEFIDKVFLPFEQEHNKYSDKTPGTGLGLTIVRNLVEIMGGTIKCESELGKGTKFTLEIVREVLKPNDSEDSKMQDSNTNLDEDILKDCNILVAEDNDVSAMIAEKILQRKGVIVKRVANGKEAVRIFEKSIVNEFQAILMDVRMPIIDGIEATSIIRKMKRDDAKKVVIIAMTADSFTDDMDKTELSDMDAHLSKPIEPELLFKTITKCLSDKKNI